MRKRLLLSIFLCSTLALAKPAERTGYGVTVYGSAGYQNLNLSVLNLDLAAFHLGAQKVFFAFFPQGKNSKENGTHIFGELNLSQYGGRSRRQTQE